MNDNSAATAVASGAPAGKPRRPPGRLWLLTIVGASNVTPRMRRVVLEGETLDELDHKPGQDVVLIMPQEGSEPARRHYTIRSFDRDAKRLAIDFVLHDDSSPAMRWVNSVKAGDRVDAQGPRGRTVINPDADWHLFTGDETCLPAIFGMLEILPTDAQAYVFLEVFDQKEAQPLATNARVAFEWIYRDGPAQPTSAALIERFQNFAFRPGRGQAYVIGETSTVRAQRHALIARGFDKTQIAAEGYWRPGRLGGHDHVRDEGELPNPAAR